MIYTVTFNPSLDYIVRMDHFEAGAINRVSYEHVLAGGMPFVTKTADGSVMKSIMCSVVVPASR